MRLRRFAAVGVKALLDLLLPGSALYLSRGFPILPRRNRFRVYFIACTRFQVLATFRTWRLVRGHR